MSRFEIGDLATLKRVIIAKKQEKPEGTLYRCEIMDASHNIRRFWADNEMLTDIYTDAPIQGDRNALYAQTDSFIEIHLNADEMFHTAYFVTRVELSKAEYQTIADKKSPLPVKVIKGQSNE